MAEMMTVRRLFLLCAAAVTMIGAAPGPGAVPCEAAAAVKDTTDKILVVIKDPELRKPGMEAERRARIRRIADERFAWSEMARRSMGRNWAKLSEDQRQEFLPLFNNLVYQTYMDKVADYSGEKIVYSGEQVDGGYSTVSVTIITEKNTEIPVKYRMMKEKERWAIYDVSIEGVSLVNNYRTQFSEFLTNGTIDKLIARLKEKVAQGAAAAPAS
jgi:phospholipid transport system substrate-binding protein